MSSLSLTQSINTWKTPTYAEKFLESDRFLNPSDTVCYYWNGVDTAGRFVPQNNHSIRTEGCNSALEQIHTENELRPDYIEFINAGPYGIRGNFALPPFTARSLNQMPVFIGGNSTMSTPASFGQPISNIIQRPGGDIRYFDIATVQPITTTFNNMPPMYQTDPSGLTLNFDKLNMMRNRADLLSQNAGVY